MLFSVLAHAAAHDQAQASLAYEVGMRIALPRQRPRYAVAEQWVRELGAGLSRLEKLQLSAKKAVIEGLVKTVAHDSMLNVAEADLEKVIQLIPSITAPTVATLHPSPSLKGIRWFSVESVLEEAKVRDLIPLLIRNGAVGIIEYPLNKVI